MRRLRAYAVAAIAVPLAAASLTGCSTPATEFHVKDVQPAVSRVNAGELQVFAGSHTLEAEAGASVDDLHWQVSYGPGLNPTQFPVASADGVATLTANFVAPTDGTKRSYRACLSLISQPTLETCKTISVGSDSLWNVRRGSFGTPIFVNGTQTGHALSLTFDGLSGTPLPASGTLSSPFLLVQTVNGAERWFEWVSPFELRSHGFGGGSTDPVSWIPVY